MTKKITNKCFVKYRSGRCIQVTKEFSGGARGLTTKKSKKTWSILQEHLTFKLYMCLWNWLSGGGVTVHYFTFLKHHKPHWSTALVFMYLWLEVNLVCCLLELPDFSDDVRNLKTKQTNNHENLDGHFFLVKLTRQHTESLPFSSWRSWPSCLRCSSVFLPQWKPGQWDTSPDRAHREDHSWWENNIDIVFLYGMLALLSCYKTMSLNWTHFFKASLRFLNLPSDETSFCSLSINAFV